MAVSISSKTVGLVLAGAIVGAWFGTSMTQQVAREQAGRVPAGVRPIGSSTPLKPRAERIRERVTHAPLPERGRNPFVYGSRVASRAPSYRGSAPQGETPAEPITPPMPVAPPAPVFRLSGIATDFKDGATVFTAILNDNGSIVFAKAGDKLSSGYSVVRVEEMAVTLIDSAGVTQTLRLP